NRPGVCHLRFLLKQLDQAEVRDFWDSGLQIGDYGLKLSGFAPFFALHPALGNLQQDGRGLEIAMHDALSVEVDHAAVDGSEEGAGGLVRQRAIMQERGKACALDIFHCEEVLSVNLSRFVDLDDVRMVQAGRCPGLGVEAADLLPRGEVARKDHLQSHDSVEIFLTGTVDHAHAATPNLVEELVPAKVLAEGRGGS